MLRKEPNSNYSNQQTYMLRDLQIIEKKNIYINFPIHKAVENTNRGRHPLLKATKEIFSSSKPHKGSPFERYKIVMNKRVEIYENFLIPMLSRWTLPIPKRIYKYQCQIYTSTFSVQPPWEINIAWTRYFTWRLAH